MPCLLRNYPYTWQPGCRSFYLRPVALRPNLWIGLLFSFYFYFCYHITLGINMQYFKLFQKNELLAGTPVRVKKFHKSFPAKALAGSGADTCNSVIRWSLPSNHKFFRCINRFNLVPKTHLEPFSD